MNPREAAANVLRKTTSTIQPKDPQVGPATTRVNLSLTDRRILSDNNMNSINAAISARQPNLEQNLKDWTNLYEMILQPGTGDDPWPGASNIFIPVVAPQLDTSQAYIAAKTLVPRFYMVTGENDQAQQSAHLVERYLNNEFVKQRGPSTWYDKHVTWLHLGLRDGTAIMEAVWRRTKKRRKMVVFQPRVQDGVPVLDMSQTPPVPMFDKVIQDIDDIVYDDVELTPVALKDFLIIPDESYSIEDAVAVAKAEWLYESDLMQMVAEGTLWPDAVERALSYVSDGSTSDVASDRQGTYDKTAGGQINIGLSQGSQTGWMFKNRGPIKVWRIHSRQYDMDKDLEPEENIFYYHERSQETIGWMPYEYIRGDRPFFAFSPWPRPNRFYGYSLVERLSALQGEINKMYNDRNNAIDLRLNPPRVLPVGTEMHDDNKQWGPGVEYEGEAPPQVMELGQIPIASWEQEAGTKSYIADITGQNAPTMGTQSSGRRTAAEMKMQAAATGTRNDLVAIRYRIACRALINFIFGLKIQYMQDNPKVQTQAGDTQQIPRQVLTQALRIDVSGATDPIDATTRQNQSLGLYQLLEANPIVQGNPAFLYAVTRMVLEDFGRADITTLIGTPEQLQQQVQAAQAAQQQAAATGQAPPGGPPPHGGGAPKPGGAPQA